MAGEQEAPDELNITDQDTVDSPPEVDEDGIPASTPESRGDILGRESPTATENQTESGGDESPIADQPEETASQGKPTDIRIPKARFDEINQRMKDAEAEVARLKGKPEDGNESDAEKQKTETASAEALLAKEKEYMAALIDGDTDQAATISLELHAMREATILAKAQEIAASTIEKAKSRDQAEKAQSELIDYADQIIKDNPYLGANGDQSAITAFGMWREHFKAAGDASKAAMSKALAEVKKTYGHLHGGKPTTPAQEPKTNLAKKDAVAKQQPPRATSAGVGNRSAQVPEVNNYADLTDEEFAHLSPSQLKAARGDAA